MFHRVDFNNWFFNLLSFFAGDEKATESVELISIESKNKNGEGRIFRLFKAYKVLSVVSAVRDEEWKGNEIW